MNHGVKILIERMQSNPEDFTAAGRFGAYRHGLDRLTENDPDDPDAFYFLSEEDRNSLREAWRARLGEDFTAKVMEDLMRDQEEVSMRNTVKKQTKSMGVQNNLSAQQLQNEYARQMALSQVHNSVLGATNGGIGSASISGLFNKPNF